MSIQTIRIQRLRAMLSCLTLIVPTLLSAQQWGGFPAPSCTVGDAPVGLAMGDFNEDGITDIATTAREDVWVLIGNGVAGVASGTFKPAASYIGGDSSLALATGDFNGDGMLDLVTCGDASKVRILFGKGSGGVGNGQFTHGVEYATNSWARDVTTGDFNGDGLSDVALADSTNFNVSILLANSLGVIGDDTLGAATDYGAATNSYSITSGDFNEDGIIDLATANYGSQNVSILLGNGAGGVGDGTFQPAVIYAAGGQHTAVVTADFNGDGITDLAVPSSGSSAVALLLGNGSNGVGDGTFQEGLTANFASSLTNLAAGDFNGDGLADLFATSLRVSVMLAHGNGGTWDGTFEPSRSYVAGGFPRSLATRDLNGDGLTDVVVANNGTDNVSILLANRRNGVADGTFPTNTEAIPNTIPQNAASLGVTMADFNGDGIGDLAATFMSRNVASVLNGNSASGVWDGTFGTSTDYATGTSPAGIESADFNEDGIVDLVVASRVNGLSVRLGNGSQGQGDGTFGSAAAYATSRFCLSVKTGDFNEDGILDLVAPGANVRALLVLLGNGSGGVGDGSFAPEVEYPAGISPTVVTTGDFNGDGITDLAVTNDNYPTYGLSVLLGRGTAGAGDGTFSPGVFFRVGDGINGLVAGDFDGDGRDDLACSNATSKDVTVLLEFASDPQGAITFPRSYTYLTKDIPVGLVAADFNRDGVIDLATASRDLVTSSAASKGISIYLGQGTGGVGDGTFQQAIEFATRLVPGSISVGEITGDGWPDLIATSGYGSYITVLPNLGPREAAPLTGWILYQQ